MLRDVCGIGNAIVDVLAPVDDAFLEAHKIAKGGMTLVDEARLGHLLTHVAPSARSSGGSAANTTVGVAALGGQACFMGSVADDAAGQLFHDDMRDSGVLYQGVPLTDGPATSQCLSLVTPDAQRSMNTYLGASVGFSDRDIDPALIQGSAVTYLEGYLFDRPSAQKAFFHAADMARSAGRKMALSLSDTFCVERHRPAFLELIRKRVDLLFANEGEIKACFETDDLNQAIAAAHAACPLVVVTRAGDGAVVADGTGIAHIPARQGVTLVDTTGAGDLFAAGFLFGLARSYDRSRCAEIGHLAAAEILSHYGPRPQMRLADLL